MSNEKPRKHLDLSVLHLDNARGLPYTPSKASDPDVIAMRRNWPKGTVRLAQQHTGALITQEIAGFPFTDMTARRYAFQRLATALVNSAWHTYPEQSGAIMRSVIDLPELAADPLDEGDESSWRETKIGSLAKLRRQLGDTAMSAYDIFNQYRQGKSTEAVARKFSRRAASSAVRMATLDLLTDEADSRSAIAIQNDVRTIGLSLLDETRYAYEQHGQHPSLAWLADDPRDTWLTGVPEQTRVAFNMAFEKLE